MITPNARTTDPESSHLAGLTLRELGLNAVEMHNLIWLERIRRVAKSISRDLHQVSADDLRLYAKFNDDEPKHPNAYGAVFKRKEWRLIGRKKSSTPSARAREIKVWRYQKWS